MKKLSTIVILGLTFLTCADLYAADNQSIRNQSEMQSSAIKNKSDGALFLTENKKKSGVVSLPSGLQYKVITEGMGPHPVDTDIVTVHYAGTLINGNEFDSSYKRGQPASFPVTGVIKGWVEALKLMKVGSTWELYIPPALAYGEQGAGAAIGPNETLIFKVNLISINK